VKRQVRGLPRRCFVQPVLDQGTDVSVPPASETE
jgi:hypothetical protein